MRNPTGLLEAKWGQILGGVGRECCGILSCVSASRGQCAIEKEGTQWGCGVQAESESDTEQG